MGFFSKFFGGGNSPDYVAVLSSITGDTIAVATPVIPSAYVRGGGSYSSAASRLVGKAVDSISTKMSADRHLGGGAESIAANLPRDGVLNVIALGTQFFSVWDFGMYGNDDQPSLLVTVPRANVVSITDTGTKAQGGAPVARVTFSDESFFDYRLVAKPGPEFWDAVS